MLGSFAGIYGSFVDIWARVPLQRDSSSRSVLKIVLWREYIGLFCVYIGLFCVYIGLFCGIYRARVCVRVCVCVCACTSAARRENHSVARVHGSFAYMLGSIADIHGSFAYILGSVADTYMAFLRIYRAPLPLQRKGNVPRPQNVF